MSTLVGRRMFLQGVTALLTLGLTGCAMPAQQEPEPGESERKPKDEQPSEDEGVHQEEESMQISVTVNGTPFTATIEDTGAGQGLLARLPLTLSMEELHGNEKYCYTGEPFGGEQYVPDTIEAGDLMVFGSDCLVLFYETFSNGGWSYARVGRVDDPSGLAEACGAGTASVTFAHVS